MSYKTLEKNYYKTLRTIASSFDTKNKVVSKTELPYFLERNTSYRLKSSKHWIISAISGTGKTTILKQFTSKGFKKLPNVTTRPRRSEERLNVCVFVNVPTFLVLKRRKLLFHPHKRNGVWQAILKSDIQKLSRRNSFLYLDKSVASSIALNNTLPKKNNFTFIYLISPTFKELHIRILKRENLRKNRKKLKKIEIFKRFKEETDDMKKSTKLPYVYIVNDSLKRVKKLLSKILTDSRAI